MARGTDRPRAAPRRGAQASRSTSSASRDQPLRAGDGAARRRRDSRARPTSCASAPARTASRSTTCCPRPSRSCREAGKRTLGQRHYDVQLIGGMVLHAGAIAEMKTGEGKTLTATLPVFLNTLAGDGVHLVTVNDYLARRDAEWMKPIYDMLGVTVGVIQSDDATRRAAPGLRRPTSPTGPTPSSASTTCATTWRRRSRSASSASTPFAIVDEVDNILIDEARTPLIISGRPEQAADTYYTFARLAKQMEGEEMKPKLKSLGESQGHLRGRVRLRVRREAQDGRADRARASTKAEKFLGVENLYLSEHGDARQPPDPVAQGRVALQARQGLRRDRRRGEDHRRVHRPHPRGPALVGGPAPGGRGEGGRARSARRTRRSRRSRSRTTSASTTSSPG